ncbi:two-component system response regulator LytT [Desulfohalotomaculum tongense]|uniref:LytR/AlgR family response regulator transcription factor n=1 Tax=Desulforadius tongensis TaxID=1216062 RepID=UPI0019597FDD|nr:LytTR family DNA-binding domain-containing protein [Desulforadius tongensis]MBM7854677.1 two-component system response regulator LytT [Desulforadius tongensis]
MKIILADDNPREMAYIKNLLNNEKDIKIIGEAVNGRDALEKINKYNPDAAFLDITMPGITGLDVAKKVGNKLVIVFITAHNNYAVDAFDIGSVDYLLKPIEEKRFKITLQRIRKWLANNNHVQRLPIKIKGETILLKSSEIIFLEKEPLSKKVIIHTKEKKYKINGTLSDYAVKLKDAGFVRSHKSFIINTKKVTKMIPWGDKSYLAVMNGTKEEVLISRNYAPVVKSMITN